MVLIYCVFTMDLIEIHSNVKYFKNKKFSKEIRNYGKMEGYDNPELVAQIQDGESGKGISIRTSYLQKYKELTVEEFIEMSVNDMEDAPEELEEVLEGKYEVHGNGRGRLNKEYGVDDIVKTKKGWNRYFLGLEIYKSDKQDNKRTS